jgi:hypothetical protein
LPLRFPNSPQCRTLFGDSREVYEQDPDDRYWAPNGRAAVVPECPLCGEAEKLKIA